MIFINQKYVVLIILILVVTININKGNCKNLITEMQANNLIEQNSYIVEYFPKVSNIANVSVMRAKVQEILKGKNVTFAKKAGKNMYVQI